MHQPERAEFKTVPAIDKAARVFECLAAAWQELGVTELADRIGVSQGTLHQILMTLCKYGLVARNPISKKYRLGYTLVELGSVVLQSMDFRLVAKPYLRALARQTGENVALTILEGNQVVIVDREESSETLRVSATIGARLPAFAGAAAKMLFAFTSAERLDTLLASCPLPAYTARSITDPARYKAEIEATRQRGWALDDEEFLPGVKAIATPIRGPSGEVLAALSVHAFAHRMSDERLAGTVDLFVRTAGEISALLGPSGSIDLVTAPSTRS